MTTNATAHGKRTYLHLSIRVLPDKAVYWPESLPWVEFHDIRTGYLLILPPDWNWHASADKLQQLPVELVPVIQYALTHCCDLILFTANGDESSELQLYDW